MDCAGLCYCQFGLNANYNSQNPLPSIVWKGSLCKNLKTERSRSRYSWKFITVRRRDRHMQRCIVCKSLIHFSFSLSSKLLALLTNSSSRPNIRISTINPWRQLFPTNLSVSFHFEAPRQQLDIPGLLVLQAVTSPPTPILQKNQLATCFMVLFSNSLCRLSLLYLSHIYVRSTS